MKLWLEVRWHPNPSLQVRENMLPHTSSHLPCFSDTVVSVMPARAPERVRGRWWKQTASCGLREHRVFCPSLSQQCINPTLGKINIGKDRRKICSNIFVTWGAFKHIHTAVALRLCSPVTATYSDQTSCYGQSRVWGIGVMEVQGQRPFSPTPPARLRSLKPRSKWRAQGYSAGGQEDQDMNSSPWMSSLRPHIWITLCMFEWSGGLLCFPAEKCQTAQAPMSGAPLSEVSACVKGV